MTVHVTIHTSTAPPFQLYVRYVILWVFSVQFNIKNFPTSKHQLLACTHLYNSITTFLAGSRDDKRRFFANHLSADLEDGNNVANVSTRLHWSSSGQYNIITTMSNQSYLYTVSRGGSHLFTHLYSMFSIRGSAGTGTCVHVTKVGT